MNEDLAATLATLIANAADLRRAGFQTLTISAVGDVSFTLAPPEPVELPQALPVKDEAPPSAGNDPMTYGWTNGVPGFRDPRKATP